MNSSQGIYYFPCDSCFHIRHVTGVYRSICLIKVPDDYKSEINTDEYDVFIHSNFRLA